jgi:RNA polymerase sigma-32 factor
MEARLQLHDEPYDPITAEDSEEGHAPIHYLEDHRYDPARRLEAEDWSNDREQKLMQAMERLDDRSREILTRRYLSENKSTLHELANDYGVSAERIRQLEKNAMNKIKEAFIN